ncbi:hypothetical protein KI387_032034, partial [Taxus chinensis]
VKTMDEDNEFHKAMKDEILGWAEISTVMKQKYKALATAQQPHKERLDEFGKLIARSMDVLEEAHNSISTIMLVLKNEKGDVTQDELESIVVGTPEKVGKALTNWKTLEAEIRAEYLEMILQSGTEEPEADILLLFPILC